MKTRKEWFHGRRFITEIFDDGGGGESKPEYTINVSGYDLTQNPEIPVTNFPTSNLNGISFVLKNDHTVDNLDISENYYSVGFAIAADSTTKDLTAIQIDFVTSSMSVSFIWSAASPNVVQTERH